MSITIWIAEGTWEAAVDAARPLAPVDADFVLLHVVDDEIAEVAHGAFAGLLGRGRHERDPGHQVHTLSETAAAELLDEASRRLGRPARTVRLHGRVEHEVVRACEGSDLLVCARDGDRDRLGPQSLGPATRFVVDHAPCAVLLVWPEHPPSVASMPPPPPHPHPPGQPPPPTPHPHG